MKTQFYAWDDLPEEYKKLIVDEAGEDWDCSKKHGGPLVRIDPLCEDYQQVIPEAVSIRLDQCHDRNVTIFTKNNIVTTWFDVGALHMGATL